MGFITIKFENIVNSKMNTKRQFKKNCFLILDVLTTVRTFTARAAAAKFVW